MSAPAKQLKAAAAALEKKRTRRSAAPARLPKPPPSLRGLKPAAVVDCRYAAGFGGCDAATH